MVYLTPRQWNHSLFFAEGRSSRLPSSQELKEALAVAGVIARWVPKKGPVVSLSGLPFLNCLPVTRALHISEEP